MADRAAQNDNVIARHTDQLERLQAALAQQHANQQATVSSVQRTTSSHYGPSREATEQAVRTAAATASAKQRPAAAASRTAATANLTDRRSTRNTHHADD